MRGQDCIRSELRLGRRRDKSAHHNLIYFNSFTDSAVIRGPFENVAQLLLLQAKRTGIWIQTLHDWFSVTGKHRTQHSSKYKSPSAWCLWPSDIIYSFHIGSETGTCQETEDDKADLLIFFQLLPGLSASWEAVHCRMKNSFHGQAHFLSVFPGVCGDAASCIHDFAEQVTARRPNSKPVISLSFCLSLSIRPAEVISCWNPMRSTVWMKMARSWPSKTSISLMKEITSASLETRLERRMTKSHSACLVSERILSLALELNWKQVFTYELPGKCSLH